MAIIRPLTVLIHELGHGLPALLFTTEKVQIYIGSYGDPSKSLHITIGRLEIYFKYNPILWNHGLCVPKSDNISINKNIVITLFGPIISLLFGISSILIAFAGNLHGSLKMISVFFLVSSFIDFFLNIIPNKTPTRLYDGAIVYNDGQQLKQLIKYKSFPTQFNSGVKHYNNKEFEKASIHFIKIIDQGLADEMIYRLAISSNLQSKNYESALLIQEMFDKAYNLNSDDYSNSALIKSNLEKYEDALIDYQKSLEKNPQNKYSLNNLGYTYNLINEFQKAIIEFDKAIELEPEFAYAYNNRGLAKIKLGYEKEGLMDIEKSLKIDVSNSYAYRNLGIYYFDKCEYKTAQKYFKKANELDDKTHLLEDYIMKTQNRLNKASS